MSTHTFRLRPLLASLLLAACPFASSAPVALAGPDGVAGVVHDGGPSMALAADLLRRDLQAVSGKSSRVLAGVDECTRVCIVLGRYDSAWMQQLAQREGLDFSALKGEWERYKRVVVPLRQRPNVQLVIIAGADTRGAIYGAVDLSRELGVSAWEWWADATPAVRADVTLSAEPVLSKAPSVQYRGIFLNDEDWGLQPWAAKRDPSKDIGPATYARIFELMWRLKANIIWPAMHDSTKPFYTIPGNADMARDYAIVVGTSHAEPMMRNNVREWNRADGSFNFFTNRDALVRYWQRRVDEVKQYENMYSVGIRGIHDSAMEGASSMEQARDAVTDVVALQRDMLSKSLQRPVDHIPKALTLYKEVLDIYKLGLRVPDDVTLIWPDDNYGYLHQLSTPKEAQRSGGTGLYYHLSYWGRPHDYLWLGTTHPALIRDQLERAVATGTRKVWIANVGDIKPLEYLSQYFLDVAFDNSQLKQAPRAHGQAWLAAQFGAAAAPELGAIMQEYYDLAWERRPEFMGFSQTEPVTPTRQTDYMQSGGEEAEQRLLRYQSLVARAEAAGRQLPARLSEAYFQLVLYPVRASANLNARILKLDLAAQYARMGRPVAQLYARQAQAAQAGIVADTIRYNALGKGKWAGMMDAAPRRLPVFQAPLFPSYPAGTGGECSLVYPAPFSALGDRLNFTQGVAQTKTVTVVNRAAANAQWRAEAIPSGLSLAQRSGALSDANGFEQRVEIAYDGGKVAGPLQFQCGGKTLKVAVQVAAGGAGVPVERERIITLLPEHAAATAGWERVPELGSTGSSLRAALDLASVDASALGTAPSLTYEFASLSDGQAQFRFIAVPVHPLTSANRVRIAYSLDDGPAQVLDFETHGRSDEWKDNVLSNAAERSVREQRLPRGKHRLRVFAMDPGFVLDRIEVRFDGAPKYYGKAL